MKIIPAIDLIEGKVVRLYKGDPSQKTIYSDNPIEIAKKFQEEGADMIHLVDLDATLGRGNNLTLIKKILAEIKIPVEVAGGIRDENSALEISKISQRIVLGTLAFQQKDILKKISSQIGAEKVVISVDHKEGEVVINGWQKETGIKLISAIEDFLKMGFTEFLLTNINRDGTLQGPDLNFLQQACNFPEANIIASGGISKVADVKLVKEKNAFGVILGKALYENKISIKEAKQFS